MHPTSYCGALDYLQRETPCWPGIRSSAEEISGASAPSSRSCGQRKCSGDTCGGAVHCPSYQVGIACGSIVCMLSSNVMQVCSIHSWVCCRLYLTQGRVDGIKGRGSYSGLQESLEVLLQHLSSSLQDPLITCEEVFHRQILPAALFDSSSGASLRPDPPAVDLFVGGVVQPILTVLATNFPAMFGSGIASVFHTSYCAIEDFLSSLFDVCGSQWTRAITTRVNQHHSVVKFRQMWKLDLHFQVVWK